VDDSPGTAYDEKTSTSFAAVDDRLGWILGYPFALRALGVGALSGPQTLLDYGCGPGKVAARIAREHGLRVIAVDASTDMLALAGRRYNHPLVTYHHVRNNKLPFLDDRSVDGAMACFVFLALPVREQLQAITNEVYRVLRPGRRFAILDPHSDHVGMQFSSFRSGEPGVIYRDGDRRVAHLRMTNGKWLHLTDYFWAAGTYRNVLAGAGFTDVHIEAPRMGDAAGMVDAVELKNYEVERRFAPFMIIHGRRPRTA
jgi:SAM-dependent methyltransferase